MSSTDLAFATIEQIAALYRQRKLSPVELTKLMLARIEKINPQLNAYLTVTSELALQQARKAEKELLASSKNRKDRGPLHGIPVSLKDNIDTKNVRTTAGSKILRNFIPQHDASVVTELYSAGAILLGKANMHEFAYGVTSNNPYFGPARNPWDLARSPGGSSGGSAAAVAAGLCYGSIGTDTGGSVRIPSSLCGTVGFKPVRGQISDQGIVPLSPTLDCTGPIARTTRDAALLFHAASDSNSSAKKKWPSRNDFTPVRKLRLGVPQEFFFDIISPEVQTAFDSALIAFRRLGVRIEQVSIPLLNATEDAGNQIAWPEATQYHVRSGMYPEKSADYSPDVRTRLEMGLRTLATDYLKALEQREQFIAEYSEKMSHHKLDALIVPTTPITAPLVEQEKTQIGDKEFPTRALLLRLNRPANLGNFPAISFPCGFTQSGLPMGLQLIGIPGQHQKLLSLAHAYETANDWQTRHPEL